MNAQLPTPVDDWTLADRIRWILRQPTNEDIALDRLITLVRDEKAKTADIATSLNICTTNRHPA
jgi:hypothetical protein